MVCSFVERIGFGSCLASPHGRLDAQRNHMSSRASQWLHVISVLVLLVLVAHRV
jgi:hypothetical protein